MALVTVGSGTDATKEKAPARTEAICRTSCKHSIPSIAPSVYGLPRSDTQAAFVAALLLKGYYLTPPDVIYCFMHLTRLSAVVWDLKNKHGFGERIWSDDAPLTPAQQRRKRSQPFAGYWLDADVIVEMSEPGQVWANQVLSQYPVNLAKLRTARRKSKAGGH
jgi:hypothetical protein